jgi:hypothetical protein
MQSIVSVMCGSMLIVIMLNVVVVNDESISTDLLEHGDCSPAVVPDASCFPPGVVA